MYSIIYSKKAEKQLDKLEQDIRIRILKSLEKLRIRPEAYVEKLVGDPSYKFRVGDYRILYEVDRPGNLLGIVKIDKRERIYD